jgi:hypothetical protein
VNHIINLDIRWVSQDNSLYEHCFDH